MAAVGYRQADSGDFKFVLEGVHLQKADVGDRPLVR